MFAKICSKFYNISNLNFLMVRCCSSIAESNVRSLPHVSLTGRVVKINASNSETDNLIFYTKCDVPGSNFSQMHRMCVSRKNNTWNRAQVLMSTPNQKVFVEGKLKNALFQTIDGKNRTSTTIMVTELCVLRELTIGEKQASEDATVDINSVELLGRITTPVTGKDFKSFTISSIQQHHSKEKKPKKENFNRIFVYDSTLFPILNELETKRDAILVRGNLCYRKEKDEFGKFASSSYIRATQVYRV